MEYSDAQPTEYIFLTWRHSINCLFRLNYDNCSEYRFMFKILVKSHYIFGWTSVDSQILSQQTIYCPKLSKGVIYTSSYPNLTFEIHRFKCKSCACVKIVLKKDWLVKKVKFTMFKRYQDTILSVFCSFFWRIWDFIICFQNLLTFRTP